MPSVIPLDSQLIPCALHMFFIDVADHYFPLLVSGSVFVGRAPHSDSVAKSSWMGFSRFLPTCLYVVLHSCVLSFSVQCCFLPSRSLPRSRQRVLARSRPLCSCALALSRILLLSLAHGLSLALSLPRVRLPVCQPSLAPLTSTFTSAFALTCRSWLHVLWSHLGYLVHRICANIGCAVHCLWLHNGLPAHGLYMHICCPMHCLVTHI